jgi:hypothetical protein
MAQTVMFICYFGAQKILWKDAEEESQIGLVLVYY